MTDFQEAELFGQIELVTSKALDAAHAQDWPTFDCHLAKVNELRASLPNARTLGTMTLNDTTDKPGKSNIAIAVEKDNLALTIHPEGTGTWDGPYAPILLERHDGNMRLVVWSDINQQDPTHIIDLSDAKESKRIDTE